MTDLLDPPAARDRRESAGDHRRSFVLPSVAAGLAAPAVVLAACMALALVGWYASDAGGHGTTRDALRVGTDAWLMAHWAHLHLVGAGYDVTVTAAPLGVTALGLYAAHRFARWAARTSAVTDLRDLALAAAAIAGGYGVAAVVAAALAGTATAEPSLPWSFAGGFAVGLVGGGSGLLRGSGLPWRSRLPESLRATVLGALFGALLLVAAGSLLSAVSLLMSFDDAANVLSRLHVDATGGLLYTVLVGAVAPNAALLSSSYLLGPGFAVGAGTLVSPAAVSLGPLPAFPLLAALPDPGTPPAWLAALVATPVAAAVAGTVLTLRRHPTLGYDVGLLRGTGAGVLGGLLVTVLVALGGGAVGPGRMTVLGAALPDTLVSATVAMGVGGLFAGVAATWWARRHRGTAR